jgi:hypothetical protein
MNAELSERNKDTDKQERRERIKESKYNREYERCMTEEIPEYPGREKNDGGIQMWERTERKQDGRREKKVQNVQLGEKDNQAHVEWMRIEREEGKGTERNIE